jgi:transposase
MPELPGLSREELHELIRQQHHILEELGNQNEELRKQNEELRKQVEELRRKFHRQATPFSKNKPKANPKPPGRKPGKGVFTNRQAPPERSTDIEVEASMPERCPDCGGGLDWQRTDTATTTDIPQRTEPVVTRFSVPVCRCRQCGKTVRGKAPGLAEDQAGATAHRVGPVAMAAAQALHYGTGIPVRKVPEVLSALTGLEVTASAITQDAMKQSAKGALGEAYEDLRGGMRESPVVHTDDTGWRIGGKSAFLMGFESDQSAVFQIRYQHRSHEVLEIIPADFAGVLITDRGPSYDAKVFDEMKQQKCLGHLLKNIATVVETKTGSSRRFGVELKALFQEGLEIGKSPPGPERMEAILDLEILLSWHLRDRILADVDNQRLLDGIGAQMNRDRLLTFLHVPGVEPTNNRAERLLRPAVIARKVSQCSKNEAGAYATSAFLSVIQTAKKASSGVVPSLAGVIAALAALR